MLLNVSIFHFHFHFHLSTGGLSYSLSCAAACGSFVAAAGEQMSKTNASTPNFHLVNVWKCCRKNYLVVEKPYSTVSHVHRHWRNNNMHLSICHVDICLAIYFPAATCALPAQITIWRLCSALVLFLFLLLSIPYSLYFFLSSVRLSSQLPALPPLRLLAVLASIFRHSLCNPRRV